MAKAKPAPTHDEIGAPLDQIVSIRRKAGNEWDALLKKKAKDHWRVLKVVIQFREKLHGGQPAQLNAAEAMLKARGLESAIEAVNIEDPNALAAAAATTINEGLSQFHRREGKPGIWFPANNVKAMLKENWSVLGYRVEYRGSRGALAEGVFVYSEDENDGDWIYLGEKPDGIDQNTVHTTGPSGPQSGIKRNEYMWQPRLTFLVKISIAISGKLPDEAIADMFVHAQEHGNGANRSQGTGKFDVISIEDI